MSRPVTPGDQTPRERAIDVIAAELADCFPVSIDRGQVRNYAKAALNALADHPHLLSALAGVPHPGVEALPSRDEIARLAHDTFFDHEPVPGQPWVDPWPVFADRFLALLGHTTTATLDPESTVATDNAQEGTDGH